MHFDVKLANPTVPLIIPKFKFLTKKQHLIVKNHRKMIFFLVCRARTIFVTSHSFRLLPDTIICGGVLGRIFVSRSSYCRTYLERIYLEGQFWRAKFCSETTCEIVIQWPFFSSRTAMYINISTIVCSPVHLFERGTRKTFILR